jgi:ribonuclease VapC
MIIDPSAIVAILHDEPERRAFNEAIQQAATCFMSAASFVEALRKEFLFRRMISMLSS